jgi:hypothetical protein
MVALNVVRIVSLLSLGIWLEELSPGAAQGPISFLFHANLGWALYLSGILLLFFAMDRLRRPQDQQEHGTPWLLAPGQASRAGQS